MSGRRDDGYQVRYRLDSRRTRATKLASVATAFVVAAWLAATVTAPRPTEIAVSTLLPRPTTRAPAETAGPTFPPQVERFADIGGLFLPALGYEGLTWFDTAATVTLEPTESWVVEWAFTWADGSAACICYRSSEPLGSQVRHLRWFNSGGEPSSTTPLDAWPTPADRTVAVVAWDPTAAAFYLAWAVETPDGWRVRLRLMDSGGSAHATATLADRALPQIFGAEAVTIGLWIAPDGRRARVRVTAASPFDPSSQLMSSWDVPIDGATLGDVEKVPDVDLPSGFGGSCFAEGWATSSRFIILCREGGAQNVLVAYLQPGDPAERFELIEASQDPDWLFDQTSGRVYLWEPYSHRLTWLDAASLDFGSVDVSPNPPGSGPTEAWPSPREGRTAWLPRGLPRMAPGSDVRGLAGSADGTVVYAAGHGPPSAPFQTFDSTGIWAFDAQTLGLVAHWEPAGTYEALSMTPDGAYVIALGDPTPNELNAFGNRGRTIAFHDARSGDLALVMRNQALVEFPVPEPFP